MARHRSPRYVSTTFSALHVHNFLTLGHTVVQLRLLMHPIPKKNRHDQLYDCFLAYVQCFDVIQDDKEMGMPILKRATRANGERLGEVIPLSQIRSYVNLIPRFGAVADTRLTEFNSLEHSREFFLNKYFDKNTMFALQ